MSKVNSPLSIAIQALEADQPIFVEVIISNKVGDLIAIARQQGLSVAALDEELAVFLQDEDEELDPTSSIEKTNIHRCPRIHIAQRGLRIEVVVHFNGRTIQQRFGPGKTVHAVRQWALREYNLTNSDATDYELTLCDSESALDPALHIGCLIQGREKSLCLDLLVPSKILG